MNYDIEHLLDVFNLENHSIISRSPTADISWSQRQNTEELEERVQLKWSYPLERIVNKSTANKDDRRVVIYVNPDDFDLHFPSASLRNRFLDIISPYVMQPEQDDDKKDTIEVPIFENIHSITLSILVVLQSLGHSHRNTTLKHPMLTHDTLTVGVRARCARREAHSGSRYLRCRLLGYW